MSETRLNRQFIRFLHQELNISSNSLNFVLRHRDLAHGTLPMLLWQYGFISLSQLESIFDWLDSRY